jgi:putative DNA primase/helicase
MSGRLMDEALDEDFNLKASLKIDRQIVTMENEEKNSLSDLGNARRLVTYHGHDLRFCYSSKKWLIWTGRRWAIDNTGEVIRRAKATVAEIYEEAARAGDKQREEIGKFAVKSESNERIKSMIALAQSEPGIPITPGEMDADPWFLNCQNGTINLRGGQLREHQRQDLITRLAPVNYKPEADCPLFIKFLDRILAGNRDLIKFVQKALGYALTGDCREQVLFMLWGSGANGKSTLLNIIAAILGTYAIQTPTETLLAKSKGDIPNDLARLNGPRFVTAFEVDRGRRLAESLVKQLTGQDTVSARFLFAEYFDFKPQFKLFLATNHKPVIKDSSWAIWRRIRLIPFTVQIPEKEQDRQLPEKLQAELPGILAWMVRGCLSWQREGLSVPEEVNKATGEYRQEMDELGDFLEERCVVDPEESATAKGLYQAYGEWAEEAGERRPLSQKAFGTALAERGFERKRKAEGWYWRGIGLK